MNSPAPKRRGIGFIADLEKPASHAALRWPDGNEPSVWSKEQPAVYPAFNSAAPLLDQAHRHSLLRSEAQLWGYLYQLASFCWR